jgi:hypothetical protein
MDAATIQTFIATNLNLLAGAAFKVVAAIIEISQHE